MNIRATTYYALIAVTIACASCATVFLVLNKDHGNCRVGWAAKEIMGNQPPAYTLDKIAALIIRDNKFLKERIPYRPNDWNIIVNPGFKVEKPEKWHQRNHVLYEFIKIAITALLGGIIGYWIKNSAIECL